jgi:hypothetical protein
MNYNQILVELEVPDVKIAYHVTPTKNVRSIMREGLVPEVGDNSSSYGENEERVYLFPTLDDVEGALSSWLGEQFEEDILALLQVDVSGIDLGSDVDFEVYTHEIISPDRITILTKDIDTYSF